MATPAEIAATKLAWDVGSRKSVEVRITTKFASPVVDKTKPVVVDTTQEHYIETAAGQRYCESLDLLSGKVTSRVQHYGDGKKFADVVFDSKNPDRQQTVFIKKQYFREGRSDHKDVPMPFLYLYVGRTPLHEALPKAQQIGTARVIGRDCDLYLFPKVRWPVVQDQVFYLDRETSIPLKVETFRSQESGERKAPVGEWVAESLDKIQGHYVPLKSMVTAKGPDGATLMAWKYSVDSIAFDKEYPASTFWPIIQTGVIVHDETTGKTKNSPGKEKADKTGTVPGKEKAESKSQPETATSPASVQAVPPRDLAANVSNASLGLGCAVLLAGVFLWWRRG